MQEKIIFSQIPLDELLNKLDDIVCQRLEKHFPKSTEDEFITPKQAADILKISKATLHRWKAKGKVKCYRFGSQIRYKKAEILESGKTAKRYGQNR